MEEATSRNYEFGPFRLEARQRRLWRDGQIQTLAPKAFDTLLVLAERPWQTVTRDELMKRVWPDTFVEDSNLTVAISQLRKVLEPPGGTVEYIQTLPRAGYRLVTDVRIAEEAPGRPESHPLPDVVGPAPVAAPASVRPVSVRPPRWALAVAAAIGIAAFAAFVYPAIANRLAGPPTIRSVAVLPPYSLSADTDDKTLRLGLADAISTSLSGVPGIRVLAPTEISRTLDDPREPVEIGRTLGVDAVVSGTIHTAEGRLRVVLRLVRIADGSQLWTGSFDEPAPDLFRLEDEIGRQAKQALALQLRRPASKPPTQNVDALEFYLQGESLFRRRLGHESVPFFEQALHKDPRFARAWADLAAVYAMGEAMDQAQPTVNKALELEQNLAEAHAVKGFIKMFLDFDWDEAERSLNQAVTLDPTCVEAQHWLGVYLGIRGRFAEAKAAMGLALALEPAADNIISDLGQIYYFAHEYEQAEALFKRADAIDPRAHKGRLVNLYERQGRDREAYELRLVDDCRDYHGRQQDHCVEDLKRRFGSGSPRERGRATLALALAGIDTRPRSRDEIAENYTGAARGYLELGQVARAAESWTHALDARDRFGRMNFILPFVGVDPALDELRGEPAFRDVLRRLKLQP